MLPHYRGLRFNELPRRRDVSGDDTVSCGFAYRRTVAAHIVNLVAQYSTFVIFWPQPYPVMPLSSRLIGPSAPCNLLSTT